MAVALSGTCVLGPDIVVDPTSFLVELAPGETDTRTMTIENTGQVDLDWSIAVTPRDSMAQALQAAAFAVVGGMVPEGEVEVDGEILPAFSSDQILLIQTRLPDYLDLVEGFRQINSLPVIGVGGYSNNILFVQLLTNKLELE